MGSIIPQAGDLEGIKGELVRALTSFLSLLPGGHDVSSSSIPE